MTSTTDDRLAIHELIALHGIAAIREAATTLGDQNPLGHHTTNVVVEVLGDDTARVCSKGIGIDLDGSASTVIYEDVIRRTAPDQRQGGTVLVPIDAANLADESRTAESSTSLNHLFDASSPCTNATGRRVHVQRRAFEGDRYFRVDPRCWRRGVVLAPGGEGVAPAGA